MRPVRYNVAASLDGFIARADHSYDWIPDDPAVDFAALFARVDTVLVGRKTWQAVEPTGLRPWPAGSRVFVFSSTLAAAPEGTTLVATDPVPLVRALRAQPGAGEIWLFGGSALFRSLLAAGLVDRVEVTVVPVLLGHGVPLAGAGAPESRLVLRDLVRYPSGMVGLSYDVTGTAA